MAIQHRRGVFNKFDPSRLLPGEWAIVLSGDASASDGRAAYICFAAGTVKRIATFEDMVENMSNAFEEFSAQFTSDVNSATQAANSAASNANGKAVAAGSAATAANDAAAKANAAADNANGAAGNANVSAANASTAAQAANAAASATANVVVEAIDALSHATDQGYSDDIAELGRLVCGDGYVLDGWLYIDGAAVASGGMLSLPEAVSWGDGYLEFGAHGCGCENAASSEELADAEARISELSALVASLRSDLDSIVYASALDGFVLDGWMVSNGVYRDASGYLVVPTASESGGLLTVGASA